MIGGSRSRPRPPHVLADILGVWFKLALWANNMCHKKAVKGHFNCRLFCLGEGEWSESVKQGGGGTEATLVI